MIQEKDFLYRVPVKTAPITTPGGQIRNPEILVDVEGGEFMHGNILDANSTNKLINQSVKDAVDNKLNERGYVTKDLLEAETTRATEQENSLKTLISAETGARTKGDEDLSSKIKAEQTRAEGKEKEISDKLAIVNGDSNTEGSFRKAIADVVAAAPEDLDTLKEIADKLAGNDDLHTALNKAITEKADTAALINEVTRATDAESSLQAAIATKADAVSGKGLSTNDFTAAYKSKLDGISSGANNYKLPVASSTVLGGIKTNYVPKSGNTLFKVNTDTAGNANTYIPGLIYGNDEYLSEIEFAADGMEHTSFDGKDFHSYYQEGTEKCTISLPDTDGTLALTSDCGLLVMYGDIVNNNIGFNGYKQNVLISASGNYNISNWYNSSPVGSVIDIYPYGEINGAITADNNYIFKTMGTSSSGLPIIVTKKSINLSNSHYIRLIHISDGVYVCVSVLGY